MSLTSSLNTLNNPVRVFLHERFPNTSILINEIRAVGNSATTIRPQSAVPWSLLGHAIDFRIRGYFAPLTFNGFPGLGHLWGEEEFEVFLTDMSVQLQDRAAELYSAGLCLASVEEAWLCRFCIVLAMFEVNARSGRIPIELTLLAPTASTTDGFMAGIPQEWVDDLCQLSKVFYDASAELLHHPVVLTPTFAGSDDVGGADADIIIDNCLLEIKAAIHFKQSRPKWLYQLLGYTLLDYRNKYKIDSVGFYLARQGIYIRWPLDVFFTTLAGQVTPPITKIRAEFKKVARSSGGQ